MMRKLDSEIYMARLRNTRSTQVMADAILALGCYHASIKSGYTTEQRLSIAEQHVQQAMTIVCADDLKQARRWLREWGYV